MLVMVLETGMSRYNGELFLGKDQKNLGIEFSVVSREINQR